MRRLLPAIVAMSLMASAASAANAQGQAGAATAASAEAAVGTSIENRELMGTAESFPATVGKLFCFSRVSNAAGSDVEHVWYKGDAEMARVKLAVNGSPWRTHSSKVIGEDGAGAWRCEVVHGGNVLQSVKFQIQ